MPVSFVCRACGAALEVDDELAGRPVACGNCQAEQRASAPAPVTVPVVRPIAPQFPVRTEETEAPPPRRRGLSPVGKVALITAALFGLLAAGGVALTLSNPTGWTPLRPAGGGFTVDMPGRINPPRTETLIGGLKPLTVTMYTSERGVLGRAGESAWVRFGDLSGDKGAAPDPETVPALLSLFANVIRQEQGHQELKRQRATLDRHPSLVVLIEGEKKNRVVYQLAIKEKRLFILALAGGPRLAIDGPSAKRFFGSFRFTAD